MHPVDTDRMQSISKNDVDCFVGTGVKLPLMAKIAARRRRTAPGRSGHL
jgi:hypothetical protein